MNSPKVVRGFSIASSIRQSRDSNEGCDVTFLFPYYGVEEKAHKFLLAVRSAHMKAKLGKLGPVISINDPVITPRCFKRFIDIIYDVEVMVPDDEIGEMIYILNEWKAEPVETELIEIMRKRLNKKNCIVFYHHGHNLQCEVLRNECLDYIDEEVLLGKDFSELPLNVISTFLDEKKKIDEVKIFLGLVNWAKVEAKRKGYWSNSIVWRGLIGEENLRKINFDAMSSEEFAQQIFPLGIMNVNEVADIYLRRFGAPRPTSGSFFLSHP